MKTTLFFVAALLFQQTAFAKKGDIPKEADYVVPTIAELVEHSRFKIKIEKPYLGSTTETIAYAFPAELVGLENQVVTLTRIAGTNNWESPEMTAACTESEELFSCNIYLKKQLQPALETAIPNSTVIKTNDVVALAKAHKCGAMMAMSFIDPDNVQSFLTSSGFTGDVLNKKLAVANAFACSEPAGILSYEFK